MHDVTADQANWWPPGTANSIGATYLHVVINTDVEINGCCWVRHLSSRVMARGRRPERPYDPEHFDRWDRHVAVDWEKLRAYGRAVHVAFVESLQS